MKEYQLIESLLKALIIFDANNTTMTVEECATFLGVHEVTIKRRLKKEIIIGEFHGGKYHIPKLQFLEKLINKTIENSKESIVGVIPESIEKQVAMVLKKTFNSI